MDAVFIARILRSKTCHNETTGTEYISVAGKFILIQVPEFKLKIIRTVKVFFVTEDRTIFYPSSVQDGFDCAMILLKPIHNMKC
jgi:hypothetical protein